MEFKMDEKILKERTKQFALRVIRLVEAMPRSQATNVIGNQLIRSATSVAANYRAACRARSKPDFANKMGVLVEEADESHFWLELVVDANLMSAERVKDLLQEANELTAIFVASHKTVKPYFSSVKEKS
jgi:four helix bundle protein